MSELQKCQIQLIRALICVLRLVLLFVSLHICIQTRIWGLVRDHGFYYIGIFFLFSRRVAENIVF